MSDWDTLRSNPRTITTGMNPHPFCADQIFYTHFLHTKKFYTYKYETNFLCTPTNFILITMKLIFVHTKYFYTDKHKTIQPDNIRMNSHPNQVP